MTLRYTYRELHTVAKFHRRLCRIAYLSFVSVIAVVGSWAGMFLVGIDLGWSFNAILSWTFIAFMIVGYLSCVVLAPIWFVTYICLLKAMRTGFVVGGIATVTAFVPVVSIINLILVERKASHILRRAGYAVGRFGIDKATLDHIWTIRDLPLPADLYQTSA